jgi:hypothetical protein
MVVARLDPVMADRVAITRLAASRAIVANRCRHARLGLCHHHRFPRRFGLCSQ